MKVSLWIIVLSLLATSFLSGCQTSEEDKRTAHYHFQLGVSLYTKKEYEKGLKQLLIAKKLDPTSYLIHNHLGVAYYLQGELEHAILSFRDAISAKKNYSEAHNNLGRVYIDVKEFGKARTHLMTAAADLTYPHKDKVWFNFGLSYFFEFKYKKSQKYFLKAIAANRKNCLAHSYYGRALLETENYNKASQSLDKAIYHCRGKSFDEPHYYSGIALFRAGQKSLALARLQEAIKLYPRGPYRNKILDMLELMQITDSVEQ